MANIMFVPWPEFGHVNPTLKLAKMLKRAGHEVCYAGLPDFDEYVRGQGLGFIPILGNLCPGGLASESSGKSRVDRVQVLLHGSKGAGSAKVVNLIKETDKEMRRVLNKAEPDLLIIDVLLTHLADMVAYEFGTPTALINVMLVGDFYMPTFYPKAEAPLFILCPQELDFPHTKKRGECYYIEPSIDLERKEMAQFAWDWLDESKPLIYCSLGSVAYLYDHAQDLFRAAISAMEQRPDQQLVVALGPHLDVNDFKPVSENVLVVNWAPQLELLKRASMMITHGGLGTLKECIFFSVPMIVFPAQYDQPQNAARIVYHGLGLRGDLSDISAEKISSMIDHINNDASLRARVESMSRVFKAAEDSGRGLKIIKRILDSVIDSQDEIVECDTPVRPRL